MKLQERAGLLAGLGKYMAADPAAWKEAKQRAFHENHWFIPEFIQTAVNNIEQRFLHQDILEKWALAYGLPAENQDPKTVGLVMAGNIPLVGFHDLLCIFMCGHKAVIKPAARDNVLIRHLVQQLAETSAETKAYISFNENIKGCDAYIATGSNSSSRYFEYYFGRYSHLIRRNRTSVAILHGDETREELEKLADDVYLYFGLGCRNVTKIYVPHGYDFAFLLAAFGRYNYLADNHHYKSNYDYRLAILILNKEQYMTNGSVLLTENPSFFSPVGQLHYEFYKDRPELIRSLEHSPDLQCIIGKGFIPFGNSQRPAIDDYADGIDTVSFLRDLPQLAHKN